MVHHLIAVKGAGILRVGILEWELIQPPSDKRRAHLCKPSVCVRHGLRPCTPKTMAIYHLSVKTISRSAGRSATAAAAYRAGVEIADARTGEVHDYQRKAGVESSMLILPDGAPTWAADRSALWNAAEQAERRKNSTVAREFEIALPRELFPDEREKLACELARQLVERHGCAADVCIHRPSKAGDQRNFHAHILLTTRRLGPEGFTEKTRELDDRTTGPELVKFWRERFADLQNEQLRAVKLPIRVDHRTLEEQGIERPATRHLGPAATGFERRTRRPSHRRSISSAPGRRQSLSLSRRVQGHETVLIDAEKTIQGLSEELAAAQAERERAAAEARAAREAAAREARRRAKAEEAERRARAERERIEAMSSQELAAEIGRLRPGDPGRLVEADPVVIEAREAAERLSGLREEAANALALAERQEAAWRLQHAYRARLHDSGVWRSDDLDDIEERREAAQARLQEVSPDLVRAKERLQHVRTVAQVRITDEQRPARERVAKLEELRQAKERQEKEHAWWREQEAIRQAQERQAQAERQQVAREFVSLALKRQLKANGYWDGGTKWEAAPRTLQKVVEDFNGASESERQGVVDLICNNPEVSRQVGELLADRQWTLDQDRGLSM